MSMIFSYEGKEYDLSTEVLWSDPEKINKLRELRILTEAENFSPFNGFLDVYDSVSSKIESLKDVFNPNKRLSHLCVKSSLSNEELHMLVCLYLISQKFPKYYYLTFIELVEIHFGGIGIKESLRLLMNEFPCVILDCGKHYVHNKEKGTVLGNLIDCFENSKNKVLIIDRRENVVSELKEYLEKEKCWENIYYPKEIKGNNICQIIPT